MIAECDEAFHRINKKVELQFFRIPEEYEKTLEWLNRYREELIRQAEDEKLNKARILPKTPYRHKRIKRPANSFSSDDDHSTSKPSNQTTDITDSTINISEKPKRNASKVAEQKLVEQAEISLKTKLRQNKTKRLANYNSSDDDHSTSKPSNQSTDITDSSINISAKPKRNASKVAEQKMQEQSQITLKTKLRRNGKDNALNDISNNATFSIKSEKKSVSPSKVPAPQIQLKPELENIKKENMPPPAAKPKRVRKKIKKEVDSSDTENESTRVTRSKRGTKSTAAKSKTSAKNRKDSDVILQEVPVPVVVIESDTEDDASQINSEAEKITESSAQQVIESTVDTDDDAPLKSRVVKKKTKKKQPKKTEKPKEPENKDDSLYEDALPSVNKDEPAIETIQLRTCTVSLEKIDTTHLLKPTESNLNATRVLEKPSNLNETHVIEKPSNLNETHVLPKTSELATNSPAPVNCTVVLEKLSETVTKTSAVANQTVILSPKEHQWQKANVPLPVDNLLTDDDDSIIKATPEKKPEPPRKGVKTKQMFSPYANSPVRKRVAAFEKLVEKDDANQPTRVTRTKTRNMEKESSTESTKSKYCTPITNNKLPSAIPVSDTKAYRQAAKNTSTFMAAKSSSAMKPSRAELQLKREEEQKKRLEKEEEAKRKREAMMQAKADEQRKKREEKQLKAQKAREELEREKEEKLRQILQEKEDEQQKKREWQMRKLAEIEETKRLEAEKIKMRKMFEMERIRKLEEKRKRQLATKPPPLPVDYEDSGSESDQPARNPTYEKPDWARSQNIHHLLMVQRCIPKSKIEELFQMEAQTPDLKEIFETVDERILRRNSSAVWRTPPRYSTLPKF